MPQLDKIIVFTQIFWLFLIFSFLYSLLTHYFFPIFLKSLKSRRLIIEVNSVETENLSAQFEKKQASLNQALIRNLVVVENHLLRELNCLKSLNVNSSVITVDEKISQASQSSMLYCSQHLFDLIPFYLKWTA